MDLILFDVFTHKDSQILFNFVGNIDFIATVDLPLYCLWVDLGNIRNNLYDQLELKELFTYAFMITIENLLQITLI